MGTKNNVAEIIVNKKKIELPVLEDHVGNIALDIRNLRKDNGIITYDPGFSNTASCISDICRIDGERGILMYRGYRIEDLVANCDFIEVAYLLVKGELPTKEERHNYMLLLNRHSLLHVDMMNFFRNFPKNSHPMAILTSMVASLSAFYPEIDESDPEENIDLTVTRLLSKMRTIAAFTYRQQDGQEFVNPSYKLSYCENFLNMLFYSPVKEYKINPVHVKALNELLILHADHGQNCSTSAVRLVGSSEANIYASVTAGICALWGSKHGGANQAVIEMLENLINEKTPVQDFLNSIKDKGNSSVLYGFGHRVYKTYDPRAKLAKKLCKEVLDSTNTNDPLLEKAMELEEFALKDSYFIERNLYPNVDFYTGIIFRAMGIPTNMFTVLFAMGRLPGWIAHYLEWKHDPYQKLARPRALYDGSLDKIVIPIDQR